MYAQLSASGVSLSPSLSFEVTAAVSAAASEPVGPTMTFSWLVGRVMTLCRTA